MTARHPYNKHVKFTSKKAVKFTSKNAVNVIQVTQHQYPIHNGNLQLTDLSD